MTTREFAAKLIALDGLGSRIGNILIQSGYVEDANTDSLCRVFWWNRPGECRVDFDRLARDILTNNLMEGPHALRHYGRKVDATLRELLGLPPRKNRNCCPHCGKNPKDLPVFELK